MEDWVINTEGTYFYSINRTIILELFCIENKHNDRIILKGLGKVKIISGCYAKFDTILLVGSNAVKLNNTYEIAEVTHNMNSMNFTLLKDITF